MKAPAFMQAMPSRCLLMLTVISFPPGLRLRQFCPSRSQLGFDGTGGTLGGMALHKKWFLMRFFAQNCSECVSGRKSVPA